MKVSLKPGKYVVAVSGGVDSVTLLHLLANKPDLKLTVAHFDHGIREDSIKDRQFVQRLAENYGMPFVFNNGQLGPGISEDKARQARYRFLRQVQQASGARALVTAHHRDDALETAIINILRGSGRKGLTALGNQKDLLRPLLDIKKQDILAYAQSQGLKWREDSTNRDDNYLRNYVRHRLLPRFDEAGRDQLWQIIRQARDTNAKLDTLLVKLLNIQSVNGRLDRAWFNNLAHGSAREVMAVWLRSQGVRDFDRPTLERLVIAAKTATAGKVFPVRNSVRMQVSQENLALVRRER